MIRFITAIVLLTGVVSHSSRSFAEQAAKQPPNVARMSQKELSDEVTKVRADNSELRMKMETLQMQLDECLGGKNSEQPVTDAAPAGQAVPDDAVVVTIDRIEPYKQDNAQDQALLATLRKDVQDDLTRLEAKKSRLNEMTAENNNEQNKWDNFAWPYQNHDPQEVFKKPHNSAALSSVRKDIKTLDETITRSRIKIKQVEVALKKAECFLAIGSGRQPDQKAANADAAGGTHQYSIICCGNCAKRIQKKKHGDRVVVKGDVVESSPTSTRIQANTIDDYK